MEGVAYYRSTGLLFGAMLDEEWSFPPVGNGEKIIADAADLTFFHSPC
jgi:hypothetical protein